MLQESGTAATHAAPCARLSSLQLVQQSGDGHGEAGLAVGGNVELGQLQLRHGGTEALGILLGGEDGQPQQAGRRHHPRAVRYNVVELDDVGPELDLHVAQEEGGGGGVHLAQAAQHGHD